MVQVMIRFEVKMDIFRPAVLIPSCDGSAVMHNIDTVCSADIPVFVVYNGSDGMILKNLQERAEGNALVDVITINKKPEQGRAVAAGFEYLIDSGFTHVVQLDGDDRYDLTGIGEVLELCSAEPEKMILAYSISETGTFRRKLSKFFTTVITLSSDIKDGHCGYRCYPLQAVEAVMKKHKLTFGTTFNPSMAIYLNWLGVKTVNFEVVLVGSTTQLPYMRKLKENFSFIIFFLLSFFRMILKSPSLMIRNFSQKKRLSWHTIPERGSLLGLRFTLNIYRIIGPRLIWLVVHPVLFYFFLTGKSARKASHDYLTRLFDQGVLPERPGLSLQYKHFVKFAQAMMDRIRIYLGEGDQFELPWHGRDIIDGYLDKKVGVLLTGAHLGSFELLHLLADERDSEKVHALMYTKHAMMMKKLFHGIKGVAHLNVIDLENMDIDKMLMMREFVSRGEHIGILADRPAANAEERVEYVDFLGSPAPFPVGPWQLAGFLKAPVLLIFGICTGHEKYEIFCEEFIPIQNSRGKTDLSATVGAYASRLEHYCKNYPLQWFNFYKFWG